MTLSELQTFWVGHIVYFSLMVPNFKIESLVAGLYLQQKIVVCYLWFQSTLYLILIEPFILPRSLVEGELVGHKAETTVLWESHTKATALETEAHRLSVKEQQQDFLTQLGLVRDYINMG